MNDSTFLVTNYLFSTYTYYNARDRDCSPPFLRNFKKMKYFQSTIPQLIGEKNIYIKYFRSLLFLYSLLYGVSYCRSIFCTLEKTWENLWIRTWPCTWTTKFWKKLCDKHVKISVRAVPIIFISNDKHIP